MEIKNKSMRRSLLRLSKSYRLYGAALVSAVPFLVGVPKKAMAYTVVQVSTSAPAGLEVSFIAATTSQFNASVVSNPFFPGTYGIVLQGRNPLFNPSPTMQDLLQAIVTVDSYTYVNGWANGESYQQSVQAGTTANFGPLCANATNFTLIQATTTTWNAATCRDTVYGILTGIYNLHLSSPTVVPGNWQ